MDVSRSFDTFNLSRNRIRVNELNEEEEHANAAYVEKHNLQSLFSEMSELLSEKDPKTELEAERILLDFLSHRKAERDRAALRLQFNHSFEVNLDNGRKIMKLQLGQETSTLQLEQKARVWRIDETFAISLEQAEELTEMFYELGRFVVEGTKGEQGGFISIDERDVYLLAAGRECAEAGDELFNLAMHFNMDRGKKLEPTSGEEV
ncbi:hypothetical protein TraAM80_02468 [Trypanosoma rangeli]|uniref:Uncharacterized protein n=1 Tax=Trypanosoma rangeli TaxID=5698 RepID=A0A422NTY7_TRYRA|nr:uncharacterized protein TraAM80_02468 [Trypanosoma rangeli]RNF08922.1 hypothetical protein TraAM80_02468 [Trypanosoma rangeli]|eukprot:RNF08922.1 hypothetical protein TraAM80_02468 [Trypanosoma rangeli]